MTTVVSGSKEVAMRFRISTVLCACCAQIGVLVCWGFIGAAALADDVSAAFSSAVPEAAPGGSAPSGYSASALPDFATTVMLMRCDQSIEDARNNYVLLLNIIAKTGLCKQGTDELFNEDLERLRRLIAEAAALVDKNDRDCDAKVALIEALWEDLWGRVNDLCIAIDDPLWNRIA